MKRFTRRKFFIWDYHKTRMKVFKREGIFSVVSEEIRVRNLNITFEDYVFQHLHELNARYTSHLIELQKTHTQ